MLQFIIFLKLECNKMKKLKTHEIIRINADEFKQANKQPVILALDNIRSMHNVGAAFRTADAFLIESILLGGITACPPHNEIHKTALGAELTVPWEHHERLSERLIALKKEGYTIAAVEQADGSVLLNELDMYLKNQLESANGDSNHKFCIVFGNEVFGVEDEIMELADVCLEIPQYGTKHSLNVSVSMGIVLWQLLRNNNNRIE